MTNPVFVEYIFLFDANKTFSQLSQFETAMVEFFQSRNMQANIVKTYGTQKRIMIITNVDVIDELRKSKQESQRQMSPQERLRNMQKGKGNG